MHLISVRTVWRGRGGARWQPGLDLAMVVDMLLARVVAMVIGRVVGMVMVRMGAMDDYG